MSQLDHFSWQCHLRLHALHQSLFRQCFFQQSVFQQYRVAGIHRRAVPFLLLLSVVWLHGSSTAAQDSTIQTSPENADLFDGLLELLDEPTPANTEGNAARIRPADVGLEGVDTHEQSNNPLESVRQSMLIAAGYLSQGVTDTETQQLQSDIVQRLDALIAELEQAESNRQSQSQPRQEASREDQQHDSAGETQSSPNQPSETRTPNQESGDEQPQDPGDGDSTQNSPGQQGASAKAVVDMLDPQALQQSVWGQLPEQVRKQMQSRMVERFLPSYRRQIEAYFQALLENE